MLTNLARQPQQLFASAILKDWRLLKAYNESVLARKNAQVVTIPPKR